jgi:hypothetical protein
VVVVVVLVVLGGWYMTILLLTLDFSFVDIVHVIFALSSFAVMIISFGCVDSSL